MPLIYIVLRTDVFLEMRPPLGRFIHPFVGDLFILRTCGSKMEERGSKHVCTNLLPIGTGVGWSLVCSSARAQFIGRTNLQPDSGPDEGIPPYIGPHVNYLRPWRYICTCYVQYYIYRIASGNPDFVT